ncbi:hypothetical protein ACFQ9X_55440 [Catenulispora yoronensis]
MTKGHAPGHWTKDGDTLALVGTVAPGSAAEFAAALGSGTKSVRATVTGGDLADGLAIARTIHDRKLTLVISGACAARAPTTGSRRRRAAAPPGRAPGWATCRT